MTTHLVPCRWRTVQIRGPGDQLAVTQNSLPSGSASTTAASPGRLEPGGPERDEPVDLRLLVAVEAARSKRCRFRAVLRAARAGRPTRPSCRRAATGSRSPGPGPTPAASPAPRSRTGRPPGCRRRRARRGSRTRRGRRCPARSRRTRCPRGRPARRAPPRGAARRRGGGRRAPAPSPPSRCWSSGLVLVRCRCIGFGPAFGSRLGDEAQAELGVVAGQERATGRPRRPPGRACRPRSAPVGSGVVHRGSPSGVPRASPHSRCRPVGQQGDCAGPGRGPRRWWREVRAVDGGHRPDRCRCRRTGSGAEPGTPSVQRSGRVALGDLAAPLAPATRVRCSRWVAGGRGPSPESRQERSFMLAGVPMSRPLWRVYSPASAWVSRRAARARTGSEFGGSFDGEGPAEPRQASGRHRRGVRLGLSAVLRR